MGGHDTEPALLEKLTYTEAITDAKAITAARATSQESLPTAGQGARNDLDKLSKSIQSDRASENGIGIVTQRKLDRIAARE
jgi:hypothetical protein